jgi:2-polyprenyl-3-methyl-5-hydroxy-6-metoxy-1,4-benzoquinol methylase
MSTMKNISILKDYDNFHKFTQVQRKIVTEDNFTYFRHIKIINMFKLGKQVNVLDYGCGAGTISYYLANKKCNVYGYDLSSLPTILSIS